MLSTDQLLWQDSFPNPLGPYWSQLPKNALGQPYVDQTSWNRVINGMRNRTWDVNAGRKNIANLNTLFAKNLLDADTGANLMGVAGVAYIGPTSKFYDFAPQSPGGSLVAGANTIALSPVPIGVNGTDTNHYLYIHGGVGSPEAVLIIGGSAVAGAKSGTVIVTCANTHSGAWQIQSATAGIQEAIIAAGTFGSVYIPAGYHSIYAPIWNNLGVALSGSGMTTRLLITFFAGDAISMVGTTGYASYSRCQISDLSIEEAVTRTGGAMLALHWQADGFARNIYVNSSYDGIRLAGTVRLVMSDLMLLARHYGLWCTDSGGDRRSNEFQATNLRIAGAAEAVRFDSPVTGASIHGIFTEHESGGVGFVLGDPYPGQLNEIVVNGGFLDGCTNAISTESARAIPSNGISFSGLRMSCIGSPIAVQIYHLSNIKLLNNTITTGGKAIMLSDVDGAVIVGNALVSASNNFIGISLETGAVTNSLFVGNHSGLSVAGGSTPGKYGVLADAQAHANNTFVGNYLIGVTAPMVWSATGTENHFASNRGVDDVIPTVASGASVTVPPNSIVKISGSTQITTINGGWTGRRVRLVFTGAITGGVGTGGNIIRTQTSVQNQGIDLVFDGTNWY